MVYSKKAASLLIFPVRKWCHKNISLWQCFPSEGHQVPYLLTPVRQGQSSMPGLFPQKVITLCAIKRGKCLLQ